MRTKRHIIMAVILATFACNISADETVTLRRITGAELKYLYEFPTERQTSGGKDTDKGVSGDFRRCQGLSFVIVDKATSTAFPNSFIKNKEVIKYVPGKSLMDLEDVMNLDRSDYDEVRIVMKREDRTGSLAGSVSTSGDYPMSIYYIADPVLNNNPLLDLRSIDSGGVQFDASPLGADPSSHPWLSFDVINPKDFKLYMYPQNNADKPYYLNYQESGSNQPFRLYATQNEYNLNIYQYENISLEPEVDAVGDVNVAISHVDDDPVMQNLEEGAIEMCVVMNDGSAVSAKDMMESETRYSLYSKDDKSWAESLKIESSPATVVSRAGESASTTVWMQPCYTLNYEGKKYSMPIGRISSVTVDDESTAIPEIDFSEAPQQTVIYYTLQGQRVTSPVAGNIYIRVTPTSATKICF